MAIPFDEGAGGGATAAATVSDEDLNREAKKSNTTPSYSVGHLSYPEDLLNVPDYGGNYVMFFINERVESKINQKNDYVLEDVDPAVGRAINGAGFSNIAVLGSSFLTGAGAGGLIGGLISGGGAGITKGAAVLGAGIYDLARPKGKSFLRGLVNSDEKTQKEEVEILSEETITEASELLYISICGYLLESQLADDVDKAHAIMENMSDTWAEEIIQNVLLAENE